MDVDDGVCFHVVCFCLCLYPFVVVLEGFLEEGYEVAPGVSSLSEVGEEIVYVFVSCFLAAVESFESEELAKDQSFQGCRWVCGHFGDVKVFVSFFFEESKGEFSFRADCQREVKVVYGVRWLFGRPFYVVNIQCFYVFFEVFVWRVADVLSNVPKIQFVVDEAGVKGESWVLLLCVVLLLMVAIIYV